jgi:ribonuclease Z
VQPYLDCLAFRLDTKEGSVCYAGDSGPTDTIVELARGCDILIHMDHYVPGIREQIVHEIQEVFEGK